MSIITAVIVPDYFGFGEAGSRQSRDLVMRAVLGPAYGGSYPDQEDREDDVAVVLLQDQDLNDLGWEWPMSLANHLQVIETITYYEPKAIFVDILFVDDREDPSAREFADFLDRNRTDPEFGVPIYFATSLDPNLPPVRKDLRHHVTLLPAPKLPESGIVRSYPSRLRTKFDSNEEITRYGPLSAAFALYREQYDSPHLNFEKPMPDQDIVWGVVPHKVNKKWMDCRDDDPSLVELAIGAVLEPSALMQTCPFTGTVPVTAVIVDDPDVGPLLKGKVVLYGVDLTGLGDIAYTPTHERLPGVFMHAMALDNLIRRNGNYLSRHLTIGGHTFGRAASSLIINSAALIMLTLIYWFFWHRDLKLETAMSRSVTFRDSLSRVLPRLGNYLAYLVISTGLLLSWTYICVEVLNQSPANWVGLLFVSTLLGLEWFRAWCIDNVKRYVLGKR